MMTRKVLQWGVLLVVIGGFFAFFVQGSRWVIAEQPKDPAYVLPIVLATITGILEATVSVKLAKDILK